MPTTLTNGIQLPDKGSVDWYSSMQSNYNLIDTHLGDTDAHVTAEDKANWNSKQGSLSQAQLDAIAQVATNTDDIATLQSDKADASHTHSSSDITDIDDYATKQYVDSSISGLVNNAPDALNTLNELSAALNDDSNFASTITTALGNKANSADLATVATSGSYNDLDDIPTIPTNTSDLTNDSDFVVSSNLATVATSGDYDDLDNKPDLKPVATSGDYDDLTDLPTYGITRFCSSAITDNSSVAFSAISSTNKIKVGDFLLDTVGKLYQISSVDTANETVSVATPLTQLAVDSDVVHKSGNETVSGSKTFDSNTYIYNSDNTATTPNLYLKSSKIEISSQGNTSGDQNLTYVDKNNTTYAYVKGTIQSNGSVVKIRAIAKDSSDNSVVNEIQILADKNGRKRVCPTYPNEIELGDSTYKWKTFNGLEPSSLSLPSDRSARIDISSYFSNTGSGNANSYTAPANGFIYLAVTDVVTLHVFAQTSGGLTNYGDTRGRVSAGQLYAFLPVRKGDVFTSQWYTTATNVTLTSAFFILCQGNV